jgi:hypothetical protein
MERVTLGSKSISWLKRLSILLKMLPNELANDMYSRLNISVNELIEIGLTKFSDEDCRRKSLAGWRNAPA